MAILSCGELGSNFSLLQEFRESRACSQMHEIRRGNKLLPFGLGLDLGAGTLAAAAPAFCGVLKV